MRDTYGLPGGVLKRGESFEEACIREVKEETGLSVKIVKKVGLIIEHYSREIRWTTVFYATVVDGELRQSRESSEMGYYKKPPDEASKVFFDLAKKVGKGVKN